MKKKPRKIHLVDHEPYEWIGESVIREGRYVETPLVGDDGERSCFAVSQIESKDRSRKVAAFGAVFAMLSTAAKESENVASLFARDGPKPNDDASNTASAAGEFRSSLAHIISTCDPPAEVATASNADDPSEEGPVKFSIECKDYPDPPLMHSALALVEACLGRDGRSKPGIYLLGLSLTNNGVVESAHYGVLGALVELVANPSNGDDRMDSMSRATAATFLERLAANTVRSTSLAVLQHLRDVGNDDGVLLDESTERNKQKRKSVDDHDRRGG